MYASNDIGAVVADIGTFSTRIGFAGDDVPKAHFPTAVGVVTESETERKYHFNLSNFRENMMIDSPLRDGVVSDWDLLEKVWDYSLSNCLNVDVKDSPVLLAEKPYNSPANRQKMAELMFEKYSTSALFVSKDAVLSCYACGKTSGLIIDAGASGTVISPVQEGMVETKAVNRCIVGGRLLDSHINAVLRRTGIVPIRPHFRITKSIGVDGLTCVVKDKQLNNVHPSYNAWMNLEAGRDFKESVCRMADFTLQEGDPRFTNLPLIPYELPDGTQVDVGIERFLPAELYMDPSVVGTNNLDLMNLFSRSDQASSCPTTSEFSYAPVALPALIRDSVIRSDAEMQTMLLSNMVLTGGSSSLEGMAERVRTEVEKLVHASAPGWRVKIIAAGAGERSLCPWLGGSILGSLGSFHEMWVSRAEYEEFGASIIDRKCP